MKRTADISDFLKPLREKPYQAYLSNALQVADVLDHKHGLMNTIPGLLAAWKRWGFLNGVHYVIGRKPPKSFGKPIIEPAEYEHVITSCNGSCAIIISQDRPGSSNSLTLSWLLIDKARAIQTAGVVRGRNGFRKDKGSEKLIENEENLLEHRTDGTDAFDTFYIGAKKFFYRQSYGFRSSDVL